MPDIRFNPAIYCAVHLICQLLLLNVPLTRGRRHFYSSPRKAEIIFIEMRQENFLVNFLISKKN